MKQPTLFILLTLSSITHCAVENPSKAKLPTVHIIQINNNTNDGFIFNHIMEPSQAQFQRMYIAQEGKIVIHKKHTVHSPNFGTVYFDVNYKGTEGTSRRTLVNTITHDQYKLHVSQTLKYNETGMKITGKSAAITLADNSGRPVARMGTTLPPTQFKQNKIYISLTLNRPITTSTIALVGATAVIAQPTTAVDY